MDISYEKILYRIIKGRLRIKLGDLILYIYEPTGDALEESYEIYDEAYEKAYYSGCYVDQEVRNILYDLSLWNPGDDKKIKEIDKNIDNLKVDAFQSFFDPTRLAAIKTQIKYTEGQRNEITNRNQSLDHVTCRGVAKDTRNLWLVQECCYHTDGRKYEWDTWNVKKAMTRMAEYIITTEEFRMIARNDPWRGMWSVGKSTGNLFNKCVTDFTDGQRILCSYSSMYDNVYESMDRPPDKVVEDDICLDGWFVDQKRKYEKEKKQKEVDALTQNPKIANSQEVFVMASNQEAANQIYDLNDPIAMSTIKQRNAQIDQVRDTTGGLDFRKLNDIKQDMAIQGRQEGLQKMRGR